MVLTTVLITADAVESGESLRLRVVDADRFSSDDAVGGVEEDLASSSRWTRTA